MVWGVKGTVCYSLDGVFFGVGKGWGVGCVFFREWSMKQMVAGALCARTRTPPTPPQETLARNSVPILPFHSDGLLSVHRQLFY